VIDWRTPRARALLVGAGAVGLFTAGAAFAGLVQDDGSAATAPTTVVAAVDRVTTTTKARTTTTIVTTTTTVAAPPTTTATVPTTVRRAAPPPPAPVTPPATVVVPNLVGMRLPQATSATDAAGLTIGWPTHCRDEVTAQSPAPGTRVDRGTRVTVELVPCVVPNLVGMRLEAAKDAIARANLRISWPAHCDDTVTGQSPPANTRVDPGATVTVQLPPPGSC
jgi:hypothetical protein